MGGGRATAPPSEEEDHYAILDLPSGEDGAKLSVKEIERGYKVKAREGTNKFPQGLRRPPPRPPGAPPTRVPPWCQAPQDGLRSRGAGGCSLDKEKVLKVSWEKGGGEYGAAKLREIFEKFGEVEDMMLRSKGTKKKGSALVVMSTKASAVAAVQNMSGSLFNPLRVLPLQPVAADISKTSPVTSSEPVSPKLSNLVGLGYQAYEDSVIKKLQKAAAEKQK